MPALNLVWDTVLRSFPTEWNYPPNDKRNSIKPTLATNISLNAADQACINYIIRGRLAGLFKHIHEHTNLDGADAAKPGQIKLSLPATEHFPFLKSAAQQGNTVEFTFNDIIPQLSGRKLVATFGIEKGYSGNQLAFSGSDQTTVPHELLLYNILPPSARHADADTDGDNTTD